MASRRTATRKRTRGVEISAAVPVQEPGAIQILAGAEMEAFLADVGRLLIQFGVTPESVRRIPGIKDVGPNGWKGLSAEQSLAKTKLAYAVQYVEDWLNPGSRQPNLVAANPNDAAELKKAADEIGQLPPVRFAVPDPVSGKPKIHFFPRSNKEVEETLAEIRAYIAPGFLIALPMHMLQIASRWAETLDFEFFPTPAPDLVDLDIRASEAKFVEWKMVGQDDKAFIQDGVRYFPLSVAAPVVQAPASTLLDWIKKKTPFDGRPLQSYHFAPANRYLISEESIARAIHRFIKWPSQEPAGAVTLGQTDDENGYIGLTDAARMIGVDHHTMWRWTTKGTAPGDKPLQVIKCPQSDQYYIHEEDVSRLKRLVPRSGLRRGRRPQLSP